MKKCAFKIVVIEIIQPQMVGSRRKNPKELITVNLPEGFGKTKTKTVLTFGKATLDLGQRRKNLIVLQRKRGLEKVGRIDP